MDMETFKALSIEDKIEEYCKFIVPILQNNEIPNEAIDWKLSDLADRGAPEMRLQRVAELFHFIDSHEDKISNDEFRDLTIELLNKYPADTP